LKIAAYAFIGIIALGLAACSKVEGVKPQKTAATKAKLRNSNSLNKPFHGGQDMSASAAPISPYLKSLKNNHLEVSSTKTIGEAFDAYKHVLKKEWKETATVGGTYFIDYICELNVSPISFVSLKEGVMKRSLDIKFAIREDGTTFISMASLIDIKSDGMIYTTVIDPVDIKKIVTAIYENREIIF